MPKSGVWVDARSAQVSVIRSRLRSDAVQPVEQVRVGVRPHLAFANDHRVLYVRDVLTYLTRENSATGRAALMFEDPQRRSLEPCGIGVVEEDRREAMRGHPGERLGVIWPVHALHGVERAVLVGHALQLAIHAIAVEAQFAGDSNAKDAARARAEKITYEAVYVGCIIP